MLLTLRITVDQKQPSHLIDRETEAQVGEGAFSLGAEANQNLDLEPQVLGFGIRFKELSEVEINSPVLCHLLLTLAAHPAEL